MRDDFNIERFGNDYIVTTPDGRAYATNTYEQARDYIEYYLEREYRERMQHRPEIDHEAIKRQRIKTNRNNTINDLLNDKD